MEHNKIYSYYAVAYIDLLGQKDAYKNIKELPKTREEEEALKRAHIYTVEFIKIFRKSIKEIFEYYCSPQEKTGAAIEPVEDVKRKLRNVKLEYNQFSDYIQIYVPLYHENEYHITCVNGIIGIFMACGGMMLISLAEEHAFRAGIDIGLGIKIEENEIYGPALINAYLLESRIAEYPRIVVGDTIIEYLLRLKEGEAQFTGQQEIDINACKIIGSKCLNMISTDSDGISVIDYLGPEIINMYKTFPGELFDQVYGKAQEYVEKEYAKRRNSGDRKLALRYERLLNYFKSRPIN